MTDAPPDVPYHSPMEKTVGTLADGNRMKRFFVVVVGNYARCRCTVVKERREETATCVSFHFQGPGYQEHEPDQRNGR